MNNAHLNDVDAYYRLVPAFHRLLRAQGGDLNSFYREVETLAKLPKLERHRRLQPWLMAHRGPLSRKDSVQVDELVRREQ